MTHYDSLKEKKKQLEDQYYQRVEQLKMVLKKEAELTSIIPQELRKYENSDDESWHSEMKNKNKQIKTIKQTTFTNKTIKDNSRDTEKQPVQFKITKVTLIYRGRRVEIRPVGH